MSTVPFDALLATRGPQGLCDDLRDATAHALHDVAVRYISAMMRIDTLTDHMSAHHARSAEAITDALHLWPDSLELNAVALGALFRVWGGGVPPFEASWMPTERLVQAVVAAMRRHQADHLATSAGLRLLKMHTRSAQRLVLAPQVLAAVADAMRAHPQDETVQHWSAEAVVAICANEPTDVIAAHGLVQYSDMGVASIQLALAARRPATLFIAGSAWYDKVLELFPRLRSCG